MKRKIININADKCNGCRLCVAACHEGAIGMVAGKAKLLRDDYCDGLGDCLPVCPTGAITFEERDALAYDEAAIQANTQNNPHDKLVCGCPGTSSKAIVRNAPPTISRITPADGVNNSALNQWPVQIKLAPVNAPYFENANLLVSADCAAYAYGNFHQEFISNRITLIGCPKLDEGDYASKLTEIITNNNIKSVTVVRMSVPCCGGIEAAVKTALTNSQKIIPWQVITITPDGNILK